MFGLIYTAIVGLAKTIHSLEIINENEKRKRDAIKKGDDRYIDYRGAIRLCSTDEYIKRKKVNEDDCLIGKNGRIIKNLDAEKRKNNNVIYEKNKKLAIENGNTVYYTGWKKIYGYKTLKTYRDIETDEEYCCLRSKGKNAGKYHYRRIKDGMFIRLADCEIRKGFTEMDNEAIKANDFIKSGNADIKLMFTNELGMDLSVPECDERLFEI